jgi:hypothetical protein
MAVAVAAEMAAEMVAAETAAETAECAEQGRTPATLCQPGATICAVNGDLSWSREVAFFDAPATGVRDFVATLPSFL